MSRDAFINMTPDDLLNIAAPAPPPPVRPIEFTLPEPLTQAGVVMLLRYARGLPLSITDMAIAERQMYAHLLGRMESIAQMEMRMEAEERERREEMAKTPANTIQLETGEKRETNSASRLFFVYVTPTGAEMPISKCPGLKKEWGRTNGMFESDSRQTITEFAVQSPCTIKMVNLQSTFGRPKRVVNLMINIDPEAATIEVKGLEGFGTFKGRAKIEYTKSTYFVNRENFTLTEAVLKEHFGLRTLQPPLRTGGGKSVRSLIFE